MMDIKVFAERVKEERKRLNLTQDGLSTMLGGGNRSRITAWERGTLKEFPSVEVLNALSEIFSCDIDYLLGKQVFPTRAATDIGNNTGFVREEINGLIAIWEQTQQKRNTTLENNLYLDTLDRQNPFINAHAALKRLLFQSGNGKFSDGLIVLSYINLYLEASRATEVHDPAYNQAQLKEEDVALTAITKALTMLKHGKGESGNNGNDKK